VCQNSKMKMKQKKIVVVGSGYVGMSLSVLLAQENNVVILDINSVRVNKINLKKSPIKDNEIEYYLKEKKLNLSATLIKKDAYCGASLVIIATPTDYDPSKDNFDTLSVDKVVKDAIELTNDTLIVIKSTLPVGHTKKLQEIYKTKRIIFSPEFLREGQALKDNLYPSRIVIGGKKNKLTEEYSELLTNAAIINDTKVLFMNSTEAEAVKLFANSYLAMRVSYFNELDSFAHYNKLDVRAIIDGVCSDNRIGEGYSNPSFGYGGYCLPKDAKQLRSSFKNVPNGLISAIVSSNKVRQEYIAKHIISLRPSVVGIHRLVMKSNSDNFRSSSIQGIIDMLSGAGIFLIIYEPLIAEKLFKGHEVLNELEKFKSMSDIILTNRYSDELNDVTSKVFTRDVFLNN